MMKKRCLMFVNFNGRTQKMIHGDSDTILHQEIDEFTTVTFL